MDPWETICLGDPEKAAGGPLAASGGLWRPLAAWLLWRPRLAALAARGGPQWPLAARGGLWRPPGGSWRPVAASWRPRGGLWRPAWRSGGLAERACSCGGNLRTYICVCVVLCFLAGRRPGDRAAGGPLAARWRPAGGPLAARWRPAGGPLAARTATLAARWRPALHAWRPLAARPGSGGLGGGRGGLWRPALAARGGLAALAALAASWRPLQHCCGGSV
eukprot:gene17202-biopygen7222